MARPGPDGGTDRRGARLDGVPLPGNAVLALDGDENAGRMYLVRGTAVRAFLVDEESIDGAYEALRTVEPLPAVA